MSVDAVQVWLKDNEQALSAIAALIVILGVLFFPLRWFLSKKKKPESVTIANANDIAQKPMALPKGAMVMEVEEYTASLKRERDAAKAELANAHGAQIQDLLNQIEDKNRRLANPEEALAQQHAVIVKLQEELAKRSNEIGGDARAKADAAMKAGNFDEAKEIFAQIAARTAPDVQTNADAEYALGLIAEEQVRWGDAADHYLKAVRLNPNYDTLEKAGGLLWRVGRHSEAIAINEDLIKFCRQEFGMDSKAMANAYTNLAHSFRAAGYLNRAMENYENAHEVFRKVLVEDDRNIAGSLNNMASLFVDLGRANLAEKLYRIAIDIDRKSGNDKNIDFATVLSNFGLMLLKMRKYVEAEKALLQAIKVFEEAAIASHPYFASTLSIMSTLLWETKRKRKALDLMTRAVDIENATLGENHPHTKQSAKSLATMRAALTSKN